jgi:hypothetical protein
MKKLIFIFVTISAVTAGVMGFAKLPERVDEIEERVEEEADKVQGLANTVDKYIAVQQTKEAKDREHKELMMKLFEKLSEK